MNNKAWFLTGTLTLLAVFGLAGERKLLEAIVVRVGDQIVTVTDFRARLLQDLSQSPEPLTGEDLRRFAEGKIDAIVDELVLKEHARDKRITVDDDTVDRAIETLRTENNLEDDQAFEEALASTGMTEEMLRDRYRDTILLQRAVQSEVKPAEITEEEARRLYQEEQGRFKVPAKVELQQLFFEIAEDESDRNAVRQRAQGLVERVLAGSDLAAEATLAGVELQELGAIPVGDLRPELAEALADLEVGGFTPPLLVPGGYQVIRLLSRLQAGYQPFDEVKGELRHELSMQRYQEQSVGLVDRLKQEVLVEVHQDLLDQVLAGF